MSRLRATWSISLDVECPFCGERSDLFATFDLREALGVDAGEQNTDRTKDMEVACTACKAALIVDLDW